MGFVVESDNSEAGSQNEAQYPSSQSQGVLVKLTGIDHLHLLFSCHSLSASSGVFINSFFFRV